MHARLLVPLSFVTAAGLGAQSPIVGVWKLDETSGLVAQDIIQGNNGTLHGYGASGTWVAGRYRNALQFDGIDDYVEVTRASGLPVYRGDGSPFSVAFWVKAPAADDDRVYSEGDANATYGALFTLGTGRSRLNNMDKLQVFVRNDNVDTTEMYSALTVFDDTWHHVAYVDVAGDAQVWVDGVLDPNSFDYRTSTYGTQTSSYGTFTTNRVAFGAVLRAGTVAHLAGVIDELHVFAYALSPTDVSDLLADTLPGLCRASIGEFGVGCGGAAPFDLAAAGDAMIGGSGIGLTMRSGPPSSAAALLFSFGRVVPLDLAILGFTGCTLYPANPTAFPAGNLDPSGMSATLTIAAPGSPSLACLQANFQAVALVLSPAPGAVFSDVVQVYVGY